MKKVTEMINTLHIEKKIDDITKRYSNTEIHNKKIGKFFHVPKLHKIDSKIIKDIETNDSLR